jgi:hypothetical protein
MKHNLYMNLNNNEHKALCEAREKTGSKSFRETILVACNSELVKRFSYIIQTEKELRKISVNVHQIIRKFEQLDITCDSLYSVGNFLDSTIEQITQEVSSLHVLDFIKDDRRKGVAIRMTTEEKKALSEIKKILLFKNYRTMILTLCIFTSIQVTKPDISLEYPALKSFGLVMNEAAKALNSGYGIDLKNFNTFVRDFVQILISISEKLNGEKENVA